jgi:polar amino acid transport system permease protein
MWDILHRYWSLFLVGSWPNGSLGGFAATLILAGSGILLSFPLAIALGMARVSPLALFRWPSTLWVYAFRGIPLIMIIFWAYFVVPLMTGYKVPPFATALCAIVVYESAFLAEIVRAGLNGLPPGQIEAARAVGLSYGQAMRYVVLPQALVNMIPSLVNQFVSTIKATSIVYVIGVEEVTFAAMQANSAEMTKALQTFLVLAGYYFVACSSLTYLAHRLETYLARRRMQPARPVPLATNVVEIAG